MTYHRMRSLILIVLIPFLCTCSASVQFGSKDDPPPPHIPVDQIKKNTECRVYIRRGNATMPALPDLDKQRGLTSEKLNLIQAQYIKDLRTYIESEQQEHSNDYYRYLEKCLKEAP